MPAPGPPPSPPNTVPQRSRRTIRELAYYEVTKDEFERLRSASFTTSLSQTVFFTALGIAVSLLGSLATCDVDLAKHPIRWLLLVSNGLVASLAAAIALIVWLTARGKLRRTETSVREEAKVTAQP